MGQNKTQPTNIRVADFIAAIEHDGKRTDATALDHLFRKHQGNPLYFGLI